METWQKYIIGAAVLIAALGVIWKQFLKPTLDFYATAKEMVPLLKHLTKVFGDDPDAFSVLNQIAKEFTTDSGSSLKDQVNRLEAAAEKQEVNAEHLKVGVAAQKELAEDDRRQLKNLLIEFGVNAQRMADLGSTLQHIQKNAAGVAHDLAESHRRADEVSDQPHGAAADAAAQQTAKEKRES